MGGPRGARAVRRAQLLAKPKRRCATTDWSMAPRTAFSSVLTAAKTGAEWALASLYGEFQPRLLRYFRAQAPSEAEDLAAETWIDAARALSRFEGDESAFGRWLFTIAHRRLVDLRRRAGRRREEPVAADALSMLVARPESILEPGETEALACLADLPAAYAEIVLLRVVGGFDSNEVAQIVGRKPTTVRVMQKRALERLAQLLAERSREVVTR
jgi:RNA polymerase sigma-70 factor, ECF subfamily